MVLTIYETPYRVHIWTESVPGLLKLSVTKMKNLPFEKQVVMRK